MSLDPTIEDFECLDTQLHHERQLPLMYTNVRTITLDHENINPYTGEWEWLDSERKPGE